MTDTTKTIDQGGGSAATQSDLWGERARDWAEVMEGWNGWGIPLYRQVLERLNVGAGTDLLDVGCGAGRFCRIAADRGARVSGIDATAPLVEITRERTRNGDFRVGDMEALPWPDNSFDVVTGFNSFFFGADLVRALREARRVARPGGEVAMTVFGRARGAASQRRCSRRSDNCCPRSPARRRVAQSFTKRGCSSRLRRRRGLSRGRPAT